MLPLSGLLRASPRADTQGGRSLWVVFGGALFETLSLRLESGFGIKRAESLGLSLNNVRTAEV